MIRDLFYSDEWEFLNKKKKNIYDKAADLPEEIPLYPVPPENGQDSNNSSSNKSEPQK